MQYSPVSTPLSANPHQYTSLSTLRVPPPPPLRDRYAQAGEWDGAVPFNSVFSGTAAVDRGTAKGICARRNLRPPFLIPSPEVQSVSTHAAATKITCAVAQHPLPIAPPACRPLLTSATGAIYPLSRRGRCCVIQLPTIGPINQLPASCLEPSSTSCPPAAYQLPTSCLNQLPAFPKPVMESTTCLYQLPTSCLAHAHHGAGVVVQQRKRVAVAHKEHVVDTPAACSQVERGRQEA